MKARHLFAMLVIAALFGLSAAAPAYCSPAKGELTFSASLFNPDTGDTTWQATGEYLMPFGKYIVVGPSVSLFDLGDINGGSIGPALEVNMMKGPGLFFGGSIYQPTGDLDDVIDYGYELRAGVKLGSGRWFAKLYASQVWAQTDEDVTVEPDGTKFQAGIGARF